MPTAAAVAAAAVTAKITAMDAVGQLPTDSRSNSPGQTQPPVVAGPPQVVVPRLGGAPEAIIPPTSVNSLSPAVGLSPQHAPVQLPAAIPPPTVGESWSLHVGFKEVACGYAQLCMLP